MNSFSADHLTWDVGGLLVLRPSDWNWNLHHQLSSSQAFQSYHQLPWVSSLQMADCGTSQLLENSNIRHKRSLDKSKLCHGAPLFAQMMKPVLQGGKIFAS